MFNITGTGDAETPLLDGACCAPAAVVQRSAGGATLHFTKSCRWLYKCPVAHDIQAAVKVSRAEL
jgi:hypothetical protein